MSTPKTADGVEIKVGLYVYLPPEHKHASAETSCPLYRVNMMAPEGGLIGLAGGVPSQYFIRRPCDVWARPYGALLLVLRPQLEEAEKRVARLRAEVHKLESFDAVTVLEDGA